MKRLIFLLLAILLLAGAAYYFYGEFNRELEGAGKADYTLNCAALFSEFETDEKAANGKYLDKVVEVSGTVQDVSKNKEGKVTVTMDGGMMFGVTCEMFDNESINKYKKGQKIKLKGICTGYLSDVVLVRCVDAS